MGNLDAGDADTVIAGCTLVEACWLVNLVSDFLVSKMMCSAGSDRELAFDMLRARDNEGLAEGREWNMSAILALSFKMKGLRTSVTGRPSLRVFEIFEAEEDARKETRLEGVDVRMCSSRADE